MQFGRNISLSVCIFFVVLTLWADSPIGKSKPLRVNSQDETVYAVSTPGGRFRKAKTEVFDLSKGKKRLYRFEWYAHVAVERTPAGIALIRFGPWPTGQRASGDTLAFSFYLGEKLIKSYSTLDIAGDPTNVVRSASHYRYSVGEGSIRHGKEKNCCQFSLQRVDGWVLTFNLENGELISKSEKFARIRETAWFKDSLTWAEAMPPGETGHAQYIRMGPSNRHRAIWVGKVEGCTLGSNSWTARLFAPVQLQPKGVNILPLAIVSTNSIPPPAPGEVWAFTGTSQPFGLRVYEAKRFREYEIEQ